MKKYHSKLLLISVIGLTIQERALRFICVDYVSSYDALLEKSKMRTIALETFQIIKKKKAQFLSKTLWSLKKFLIITGM